MLAPKFEAGEYTKVGQQAVPQWDGQQALTIFEQLLQKSSNKIDGVLAANDTIANSTISALKARKLDQHPDHGARRDGRRAPAPARGRAVDDGVLLDQGPGDEGRQPRGPGRPRREADRRHGGRWTPAPTKVPTIFLKPQTIRKDNIADTVIADDFVSWEEVCVGRYAKLCPADR